MILRRGERYLGALGLMDTPRASAADVLTRLRALGIRRTIMISGDDQRVADAIAAQVGIDEAWGEQLPDDKVDAVRRLQSEERRSAMVGDGVNDAPSMANSTVGIAMGAAGSDVALETADVALMSNDLGQLPFATGLSRKTSAIIKQNLLLSLGIVAVLIPATHPRARHRPRRRHPRGVHPRGRLQRPAAARLPRRRGPPEGSAAATA